MKRYLSLFILALMFCAVASIGCGGGSNYADSEQTESLNEDTDGEGTTYVPNEENSGVYAGYVEFELNQSFGGFHSKQNCTSILHGRKVEGTNADGSPKMGKWVDLVHYSDRTKPPTTLGGVKYEGIKDGSYIFYIPDEFVEFGFEFDIEDRIDWPFSGILWTVGRGKAKKIFIYTYSNFTKTELTIKVNDKVVVNDGGCFSHTRYDWNAEDKIMVRTVKTQNYLLNATRFYARKSPTAKWESFIDTTNGNNNTFIPSDYVEFGFEFDIYGGTDWPYSGVFWGAGKTAELKPKGGRVEDINIEMGGTVRGVNIYIYVNGENIVKHINCDSHQQYDWRNRSDIRVNIRRTGAYALNCSNLYARKSGGTWEKVYNNDKDSPFTISNEYVEFGFEFDITWGTDWPYSNVFWTEKKSESMRVNTIDICMGGALYNSYITIHVNGNPVVDVTNCGSHNQYNWGI